MEGALRREFPIAEAFSPVSHPASCGDTEHKPVPGVAQGELRPKALSQRFPPARPCFQIPKNQQDGGFIPAVTPAGKAWSQVGMLGSIPCKGCPEVHPPPQAGRAISHPVQELNLPNPKGRLFGLSAHGCHQHLYLINAGRIQNS